MRRAIRTSVVLGLVLSTAVGVSLMSLGCSTIPARPVALEQARTKVAQAQQDPAVATNAPVALREAEESINRAEQAWERNKDVRETQNLAAVAERRVEVARAAAAKKMAENESAQLSSERDRVLLEARTREAERAQREAERAQREADQAFKEVRVVTTTQETLEQRLAALQSNARKTERGLVLTLSDVLFASGQAMLAPGAMHRLQTLATLLKEYPERRVTIEGYTDSMGSESTNLHLSQRRAEAVRDFLMQHGVESTRITAHGFGEASPVAPNTNEAGRQQNRRVEVVIGL